jgi:PIN domain nuclease of toxin-antitoxin system
VAESDLVVDASAALALLQGEAFRALQPERLVGAWISAVNLSEVLAKLRAAGLAEDEADQATAALDFRIVPFDESHARGAARLWPLTRRLGLSLGDRACLALGFALGAPVVTADKVWARLDIGVKVVLIR